MWRCKRLSEQAVFFDLTNSFRVTVCAQQPGDTAGNKDLDIPLQPHSVLGLCSELSSFYTFCPEGPSARDALPDFLINSYSVALKPSSSAASFMNIFF